MPEDGRYALSEILAEELKAIRGPISVSDNGTERELSAALAAAGEREARREPTAPAEVRAQAAEYGRRRELNRHAYQKTLTALCLSGGGIRSAAISLGVIQALADAKLLNKFDYLSTVSGGGYIGSWLSSWLHHANNADDVLDRLGSRRRFSDQETPPLDHLREYSNYLTPKIGIFSADTWAALAIVLRNIVVNWLILVPVLALVVIGVKLLALGVAIGPWNTTFVGAACLIAGSLAFGYKLGWLYLPSHSENPAATRESLQVAENVVGRSQSRFLLGSLLPAIVAGLCFAWLVLQRETPATALAKAILPATLSSRLDVLVQAILPNMSPESLSKVEWLLGMAVFAAAVYLIALLIGFAWANALGRRERDLGATRLFDIGWRDVLGWIGGILTFALMVWLAGLCLIGDDSITIMEGLCVTAVKACVADAHAHPIPITIRRETVVVILGMPWFLLSTLLAHTVYLLLRSLSPKGDAEREWLGRASGWHFIAGLAWIIVTAIILLGPELYYGRQVLGDNAGRWLSGLTAASGTVTALLGKSGLTPATGAATDWKGMASNIVLGLAGPLFAALLLILLAVVVDWAILASPEQCLPAGGDWRCQDPKPWIYLAAALAILLVVADLCANINAFAMHALYRNRLVRAFLGGARAPHRHPDGFTDFDWDDDLRVVSLWNATHPHGPNWRPFHVINMTLNLPATNRLAWQQRKAMPFSVTPLFSGNADLGYRETECYGGPARFTPSGAPAPSGISLGTAMAISGAAASSNMGYHSSMSLSFLLTFFNVRLGVWLGNPGWRGWGEPYRKPGPRFAVPSLLSELFGLITDKSPYVYLTDGGHFEDLALYEMVRRRCKWIVVVDGDQDGDRGFEDLGNAVRKIWIDLGVRITFPGSALLEAATDAKLDAIPYFAAGTITYVSDPPVGEEPPNGKILYIKPIVRGDEAAADVIAYKRANAAFPAQSTANQWFDESQFESYRRLGHLMAERIITSAGVTGPAPTLDTLFGGLGNIDPATMAPRG